MEPLWLVGGILAGGLIVMLIHRVCANRAHRVDTQTQQELRTAFSALSREALSANADDFLKLAETRLTQQTAQGLETLESKKKLIDARLEEMGGKLTNLSNLLQAFDKQRAESFGSMRTHLENATHATKGLQQITGQLREALANPSHRGHWGERMAEDVLRLVGFVENVNYFKQKKDAAGGIPDFTFPLPDRRKVHMDVKFPLANYLKALDAVDDATRSACASQFLKDVRARIKELNTREYIDVASGTLDYVLVFIPNEQVYSFIHGRDNSMLDYAIQNKVVLCSPLTLYAILAVIRQSVDNFRLEQASGEVLNLLAEFKKQWAKYVEGMEKMGRRLDEVYSEYRELAGVRTRQLDRQLDRIEDLRLGAAVRTDLPDAPAVLSVAKNLQARTPGSPGSAVPL